MRGVTKSHFSVTSPDAFLLTRLMRGVTCQGRKPQEEQIFLLTRLMRGVTLPVDIIGFGTEISTHTPHARRDRNLIYFLR